MRQKNEQLPLTITGMTADGNGVGRYDGEAIFVPHTAEGDTITCKIVKVQKRYAFGIVADMLIPSPDRIAVDCPVCNTCGGCTFRHVRYEAELRYKENIVRDAFVRLGKLTPDFLPILGAVEQDGYRNKAQYPLAMQDGKVVSGFYAKRSHRIVPCTDCALQPPLFGEILRAALLCINHTKLTAYDETAHNGLLRHLYLRRGHHSGEIMLCFVVRKPCKAELLPICAQLQKRFPMLKSCMMNVNGEQTNVILGKRTSLLLGTATISDTMCGNRILLSPQSFYQVNTAQAERLYAIAASFAALKGKETLLDLYCGVGTIGLSMAKQVGQLIGVEVIPQAVENARENAACNGIANAVFYNGDAAQLAQHLAREGTSPDVIVLDPPRKGCDTDTLLACAQMKPTRIVMISCNPATAARDCAALELVGYRTERVQAVDLFPRTGHVECAILMTRVNPKK